MEVTMRNEAGMMKKVKVGVAWTVFFFGAIPFFFRGMPGKGFAWLFLSVITFGISNWFLMFKINQYTAQYYLERGYKPVGHGWEIAGPKWGVSVEDAKRNNKEKK